MEHGQVVLGIDVVLRGGLFVPAQRLLQIAALVDQAEMVDVAYSRLCKNLWEVTNTEELKASVAPLFLDAWSIVDSVHRLRELLDQMPGLKKNTSAYQSFVRKTKIAKDFRNTAQHMRNDLRAIGQKCLPA